MIKRFFQSIANILFLTHESRKKRALHNTAWLTVSQAGSRLIRAFIVIYGARALGAAEYGVFSYALSLGTVFFILAEIGLDTAMIKFAAQQPGDDRKYFSTAFVMRVALVAVSAIALALFGPAVSGLDRANPLLWLIGILFIGDSLREFGFSLLRAREQIAKEALINIVTNIVLVGASLAFISQATTPHALALGYVTGTLVGLAMTIIILRHDFKTIFQNFTRAHMRPLLSLAWPLALTSILGALMINTDILMLGWFTDEASVGAYSAAQRPIGVLYGLLAIVPGALFPIILKAKHELGVVRRGTERILSISFLLNLPIVIGGVIVAGPLLIALLGTGFLEGIASFQFLLPTLVTSFATITLSQLFVVYDKHRILTRIALIGLIGNAVLDLLLIPIFGGPGSAIATLLNQMLVAALLWKETNQFVGVGLFPRPGRSVWVASLALAVVAFALNAMSMSVWITIAAGAIVYIGILSITKEPMFMEILETFKRPSESPEGSPVQS